MAKHLIVELSAVPQGYRQDTPLFVVQGTTVVDAAEHAWEVQTSKLRCTVCGAGLKPAQ